MKTIKKKLINFILYLEMCLPRNYFQLYFEFTHFFKITFHCKFWLYFGTRAYFFSPDEGRATYF